MRTIWNPLMAQPTRCCAALSHLVKPSKVASVSRFAIVADRLGSTWRPDLTSRQLRAIGSFYQNLSSYSAIKFRYIVRNVMKDDGGYSHIFVQTPSTRIAFHNNRFGAAASTHGILSGNEQGLRVGRGAEGGRRGEGREINFVVP